ncbi:hypothetical protein ACHAWO_000179 [Cyclotella atomus]|uniref:Uncharacterized protein n=1 Tax=Cyclotella atomus TaxID=382360 RepID=A0ABD3QJB0_9STRA
MNKPLIIHTNGDTSYIDILPTRNLSDAREIILQEFDAEQYPSANGAFTFKIDGLRVSRAQEKKNIVADILASGKRVELVPPLNRDPVAFVTPASHNSSAIRGPTNQSSVHNKSERDIHGSEPFASADPSKSTISEKNLFNPTEVGCSAQKTAGQQSVHNTPTPNKPPQVQKVQQVQPGGKCNDKLPQKRAAANLYSNSDLSGAKKSASWDVSKCGVRNAGKPLHDSTWSSDGPAMYSHDISCNIQQVELKKTVVMIDLCDSSEDDSKPAAVDPITVSTTVVKDFTSMDGAERKVYLSDGKNLVNFFKRTLSNLTGAECEVCAETGVDKRCNSCGKFYHAVCVDESCHIVCLGCQTSDPQCHLCNQEGGIIVKSYAKCARMKRWKGKKGEYEASLFGNGNYCHMICGM